jgi:hypothetical protein
VCYHRGCLYITGSSSKKNALPNTSTADLARPPPYSKIDERTTSVPHLGQTSTAKERRPPVYTTADDNYPLTSETQGGKSLGKQPAVAKDNDSPSISHPSTSSGGIPARLLQGRWFTSSDPSAKRLRNAMNDISVIRKIKFGARHQAEYENLSNRLFDLLKSPYRDNAAITKLLDERKEFAKKVAPSTSEEFAAAYMHHGEEFAKKYGYVRSAEGSNQALDPNAKVLDPDVKTG